ncbi:DUF1499 domain-containing protein [Psychromonas sp. SP041]|uniref:DUF1499 domain-containing protein n=1 Tax=Psychromonas sp. SP041 TaxID=1365007 RepID=UPI000427AC77|nr:DUF1499 domain-containing protein [Psychromonas sp. SP041]
MKRIDLSNTVLFAAVICLLIAALMVFGSSIGLWEPIVGFGASRSYNNILGYIVIVSATISLVFTLYGKQFKSAVKSLIALVLGLMILGPAIANIINEPTRYPPIHDITTDTQTPPQFIFLTDQRPGSKNTLVYGGEEIAQQQLKAFPNIKPLISNLSAGQAYDKAVTIANSMGWQIVAKNADLYTLEATARTAFFNFADDVVIRVSPEESGSRIDIRSVSRIGRGDRGVNAKRITEFTKKFSN